VTVANIGDSRVVLGYRQELFSVDGHVEESELYKPFACTTPTDTAATTPEDCGSIEYSNSNPISKSNSQSHSLGVTELDLSLIKECDTVLKANQNIRKSLKTRKHQKIRNVQLSSDHKPDVPKEKSRIMLAGTCYVYAINSWTMRCDDG
jgi:hypothetical protein